MFDRLLRILRIGNRPSIGDRPARRTFGFADIKRGWLVEDADEVPLGSVVSSGAVFLTVSRGRLLSRRYLPPSVIAEVHEGIVRLNVTSEWIEAQGCGSIDRPPEALADPVPLVGSSDELRASERGPGGPPR